MLLTTKWKNAIWDPSVLNSANILNYFCDRSNPFYNNQCNNEKAIMQKISVDITQLQGEEYSLVHAQEPILFIVCKQLRKSPVITTPLSYYYIVNGEVMQAPDMASLINARLQTSLFHMNESFQTLLKQVQHHPSNGTYSWNDESELKSSHQVSSVEERQRNFGNQFHAANMQLIMNEWLDTFPTYQIPCAVPAMNPPAPSNAGRNVSQTPSVGSCTPRSAAVIPSESVGQPPTKKIRM